MQDPLNDKVEYARWWLSFERFVETQPDDKPIDHSPYFGGSMVSAWYNCAIGDYAESIGSRRDMADRIAELMSPEFNPWVDPKNDRQALAFLALSDPDRDDCPRTYGALKDLLGLERDEIEANIPGD